MKSFKNIEIGFFIEGFSFTLFFCHSSVCSVGFVVKIFDAGN